MNRTKKFFFLIAVILPAFALTSCDDDDFPDEPPTASVEGRVFTQNEFGQPLWNERSGITVYLETAFRNFTVQANNTGIYRLTNAPGGTYLMRFSKPGFGTILRTGIPIRTGNPQFEVIEGFQQMNTVTLTKLPTTTFNNVQAVLTGDPEEEDDPFVLTVSATMSPPPPPTGQAKGFRVFVGTNSNVSRSSYVFQKHFTTLNENFTVEIEDELFDLIPSTPGSLLWVAVYGDANFDESYEDETDQVIFPNLTAEPGQRVSVVIP